MLTDKQLRGSTKSRTFITVPMTKDLKARIVKAARRNELSTARYIRRAVAEHMINNNEWSIPGPKKKGTQ